MTGNGGWLSISAAERVLFDTPAPKVPGREAGAAKVFDRGAAVRRANVATLVERLKRAEPTKH